MCRKQKSISIVKINEEQLFMLQKSRKFYCTAEGVTAQQKALLRSKKFNCIAEGFTAQQKVLLHNRKLYCTIESLTAQQKALLHNRRFYCTAESFPTQQKSQSCGRNWRKVPSAVETNNKPTLQCFPLDLDSTFAHKLVAAKWYFGANSVEHQTQLPSQKKPRLSVVQ